MKTNERRQIIADKDQGTKIVNQRQINEDTCPDPQELIKRQMPVSSNLCRYYGRLSLRHSSVC